MLTPEQAFRVGFLARCAEEGLCGASLDARLGAADQFSKRADAAQLIGQILSSPMTAATFLGGGALLGGVGAGALAGTGAGMMAGPEDPGKIKPPPFLKGVQRSEYAAALRQQAAELRRQREGMMTMPAASRSHYGI